MSHTLDRLSVADIDAALALEASATDFPWSRKSLQDSLEGHHIGFCFRGAERLLAFAILSLIKDQSELLNIAVAPKQQGRGLGKALLIESLNTMHADGAETCMLEVRAGNRRAIDLYHGLGFYTVGERPGYYPARSGREDALLMCLPLPCYEEE